MLDGGLMAGLTQGGAAPSKGEATFVFNQTIPSTVWNINHNLNRFPSIELVDTAGDLMMTNIDYIDANNIRATFSAATAGQAYVG